MSSLTRSPLGDRIEYVREKTGGVIEQFGWTALGGGRVFYPPKKGEEIDFWYLEQFPIKTVAKLSYKNELEADVCNQLDLLLKAAKRGDNQGLDGEAFKAHADVLIKAMQPTFLVHNFKVSTKGVGFTIIPVFNWGRLAESAAWWKRERDVDYWGGLGRDFAVFPEGRSSSPNYFGFRNFVIFTEAVKAKLISGKPATVYFPWVQPTEAGQNLRMQVQQSTLAAVVTKAEAASA